MKEVTESQRNYLAPGHRARGPLQCPLLPLTMLGSQVVLRAGHCSLTEVNVSFLGTRLPFSIVGGGFVRLEGKPAPLMDELFSFPETLLPVTAW